MNMINVVILCDGTEYTMLPREISRKKNKFKTFEKTSITQAEITYNMFSKIFV